MKFLAIGASMPCRTSAARWTRGIVAFAALTSIVALAPTPAKASEHSLAGIKIFASVHEVLARFGEPTQILTGADAINGAPASGSGSSSTSTNRTQNLDGGPIPPSNRPSEFSGTGGPRRNMNPTMNPGMANGTGANGSSQSDDDPADQEVMYVYQRPNNLTLEFLLSPDGRVIQITVLGYKGTVKTSRSIGLGSGYGTVIAKYGYPESQDTNSNGVLEMKYLDKQHIAFELHQNKVVGIIVAAVE